jgi:hypothetical protein
MAESEVTSTQSGSNDEQSEVDEEAFADFYHEWYPGLRRDYFEFLRDVLTKEFLSPITIIEEHQRKFESKTVVYSRQALFNHLCSRDTRRNLLHFLLKTQMKT